MGDRKPEPKPALKPLKSDKDLFVIVNLERNPVEERRFQESITRDVERMSPPQEKKAKTAR